MKKVDPNKYSCWFHPYNEPALYVDSGETVLFTCKDTWGDVMVDENCRWDREVGGTDFCNPCNGPVYVNGAEPGDTMKITIVDVRPTSDATECITKKMVSKGFQEFRSDEEVIKVPIKDGYADMFGIKVKTKPFPGCLAVAPKTKEHSINQGTYGGNLDCKYLTKASVLYLPIQVPGGLVSTGDIHALQGDGEMLSGLEVAGEVELKLEVVKGIAEPWPVLETTDRWYVIAADPDMYESGMLASNSIMHFILKRSRKFSPHQLFVLLTELGDMEVCQMVDPLITMRFGFDKYMLPELKFEQIL